MVRIDRRDVEIAAEVQVKVGPKDLRRAVENNLKSASEVTIGRFVAIVLDQVFRPGVVLIRPSEVMNPRAMHGGDAVSYRPGRWGEDEPWPFDGDLPR